MIKFLQTTRVDANIADSVSICFCLLKELFRGILRPRPPCGASKCLKISRYVTYLDIVKSVTFSFQIQKFPRPHVIGFVLLLGFFFSTLESGFKNVRIRYRIRRMRVDGSRIQKEKLRIQKYLNTCGRVLSYFGRIKKGNYFQYKLKET